MSRDGLVMSVDEVIKRQCVACLSKSDDAEMAVLALLRVFYVLKIPLAQVIGDLCFLHRRIVGGHSGSNEGEVR